METESSKQTTQEKYAELSQKSLVRIQYSCSGNHNSIHEEEYIPIVTPKSNTANIDNLEKQPENK